MTRLELIEMYLNCLRDREDLLPDSIYSGSKEGCAGDARQNLNHAWFMLLQIKRWLISGKSDSGKLDRWLAFVQGVLWVNKLYSVDQLRDHIRETK